MMQTVKDWTAEFFFLAKKNDSVIFFLGKDSTGRIMNHWFTFEFSKCGLQTIRGNTTWKLIRNANSWAQFQTK